VVDRSHARVLILPGLGDSGPQHWQTLWERQNAGFARVEQRDWERPRYEDWAANLERAVAAAGPDTVLAAHSLACLLVARWAHETKLRIKGALLVAPPDPDAITFPEDAVGFAPIRTEPYRSRPSWSRAPTIRTETWLSRAQVHASWGARFVEVTDAGHINADSGFGPWNDGLALLRSLADA
jgi:predicted alpha/beta hydrolase family esterase